MVIEIKNSITNNIIKKFKIKEECIFGIEKEEYGNFFRIRNKDKRLIRKGVKIYSEIQIIVK